MTTRRTRRRPPPAPTQKILISIRLQPATLAAYRAMGKGWQTQLSADLDAHVALARAARKAGADA